MTYNGRPDLTELYRTVLREFYAEPQQATPPEVKGRKFDAGKLDYTLLPWEALEEVVKVLAYGLHKYERDNWKYVPDAMQRYEAAGFRHRVARLQGEANDPETGVSHLAHEVCCLLFQLWFLKHTQSAGPSSESSGPKSSK
jgi:hypothetical protein